MHCQLTAKTINTSFSCKRSCTYQLKVSLLFKVTPHIVFITTSPLLLFSLHFSILTVHKMHDHQSGMFNEFLFAPIHHLFLPHGKRYGSQINIWISICHLEHFWYLFLTLWNNRIWLEALNNMDHSPTKQGPSLYHLKVKLVQRPQLLQRLV